MDNLRWTITIRIIYIYIIYILKLDFCPQRHSIWDCIPFDSIPGHVGVYVCNLSSTLRYNNGGCSSSTCTLDYAYIHMSR